MTMKPRKTDAGAKKSGSRPSVKKKAVAKKPARATAEAGGSAGSSAKERGQQSTTLPSVGSIGETITARATRGVRGKDITVFLRQLIMLLEAGTPVVKALKTLSQRGEYQAIRTLVSGITEHVEAGNPLWQSFAREKKYFPPVFVSLIEASEASGTLTTVLNRLVTYREERELLEKRIKGALMYPVVLLVVCFAVVVIIAKIVIPEFESMFRTFDIPLNAYTQGFIDASGFVGSFWWLFVVAAVAIVAAYRYWWINDPIRRLATDRLKLRLPISGAIARRNAIIDFTRTFSLLQRSGISIMETLELCRKTVRNRALSVAIQQMKDSVERGEGLESQLRAAERRKLLPGVVVDMLVTGEETGTMEVIADQIADKYDEEVKILVNTLGEAVQPVLTLFMGGIVALIAMALFSPLIAMVNQIASSGI
jgi:type IV pilus assembly protein PilC